MTVYYNDNDPYCCQVLQKNIAAGNLPEGYVDGRDIRDVRATDLVGYRHIHLFAGIGGFPLGLKWANLPESISLITGGFPCQDISPAGKRIGIDGERSGLWSEMSRLVCDLQPQYVIVENSADLLKRGMGRVLGDLARAGYNAEWRVLSAAQFGARHLRRRVFILAYPNCNQYNTAKESTFYTESSAEASSEWIHGSLANTNSDRWKEIQQEPGLLQTAQTGRILQSSNRDSSFFSLPITRWQLWTDEPNVGRVASRVPHRLDRLRGLGNALVPQIAEYIGRCIMAYEMESGVVA